MMIVNIGSKLKNPQKVCPDLSEEACLFVEYVASAIDKPVAPIGMLMIIARAMHDIVTGRYSLNGGEIPPECEGRENEILEQASASVRVVSAVSDDSFAGEVRRHCMEYFDWNLTE